MDFANARLLGDNVAFVDAGVHGLHRGTFYSIRLTCRGRAAAVAVAYRGHMQPHRAVGLFTAGRLPSDARILRPI